MLRRVDDLGRIALPIEYRKELCINGGDEVEITLKLNEISVKKPIFGCIFCNAALNLVWIGDKSVCRDCIELLYGAEDGTCILPN